MQRAITDSLFSVGVDGSAVLIVENGTFISVGANQRLSFAAVWRKREVSSLFVSLLCEDDVSRESFLSFNFRVLENKRNNKVSLFLPSLVFFSVKMLLVVHI